jgi:hypothetical protein
MIFDPQKPQQGQGNYRDTVRSISQLASEYAVLRMEVGRLGAESEKLTDRIKARRGSAELPPQS